MEALSVTKSIKPSGSLERNEELAIWIDELLSNFIPFVFDTFAAAWIKFAPSFVVKEILPLDVRSASFKSIPLAIRLILPPDILPPFRAITLYIPSEKFGLFK